MALVFRGVTRCALCGEVLREGDDLVGTTHFIRDHTDPLYRYSDAAMHQECFEVWPYREAFRTKYNTAVAAIMRRSGARYYMNRSGRVRPIPADSPDPDD